MSITAGRHHRTHHHCHLCPPPHHNHNCPRPYNDEYDHHVLAVVMTLCWSCNDNQPLVLINDDNDAGLGADA